MDFIKELLIITNFDDFIKKSLNKSYIDNVKLFVNEHNISFTAKEFITLYAIAKFPKIVADSDNIDNISIINDCNYFFNNYEQLYSNNKIKEYLNSLHVKYKKWKKDDLDFKLSIFINSYYEFDQMYMNLIPYTNENDELIKKIKDEQLQLIKYIKNIGGTYGINKLNNANPIYININQFKNIATNAFWDSFTESINKEIPDYSRLIIMLKEIKILIKNLIPNRLDIHNDIDDKIDTELLLQMLSNNAINFNEIYNLMNYIHNLLKSLDCPNNDEQYNKFWIKIKKMIDEKKTYGIILKDFFNYIFSQLEEIQNKLK